MLLKFLTNSFIGRFINKGHPRSKKLKKNIGASFILKGISIIISMINVPILLSYLNAEKYGVWLTISSIVMWVYHFDLGLGHGLRNRFAEALANKDTLKARSLVSTAYVSMSLLMFIILIITIPLVMISNWNKILNVETISNSELIKSVLLVLVIFITRFVFQLISVILKADQRPAISDAFLPIGSTITLILVLLLRYFVPDSLFIACAVIAIPQMLILALSNFYFFKTQYKQYRPSIKYFGKRYLKDIYSLGLKFFVGQLAALIIFNSHNFILTQVVNPVEVTIFNIAKKLFGLPLTYFMIVLTPYWSAITEAYTKDEFGWIKSNMNKLLKLGVFFSFGIILILILSPFLYKIWIGDRVIIPFKLSLIFALYNIGVVFLAPFSHFINGVGKLNLSIRITIFKTVTFIPIAILLTNKFGAMGLVLGMLLVNLMPNIMFETLQYKKIINRTATGIWNR
jgi:O-antigen/teichoic acid export membrane protein